MIVADTSALISLATADVFPIFLDEFEVHVTETILDEIGETAGYDDRHGDAADVVLDHRDDLTVHDAENPGFESSRIDTGEATAVTLCRDLDAEFLITDDLRALPELQNLVDAQVAISPIVLKALVQRDALTRDEAAQRLETVAEKRDWLEAPIYRRARNLFE